VEIIQYKMIIDLVFFFGGMCFLALLIGRMCYEEGMEYD